jgi:hypothetical protein
MGDVARHDVGFEVDRVAADRIFENAYTRTAYPVDCSLTSSGGNGPDGNGNALAEFRARDTADQCPPIVDDRRTPERGKLGRCFGSAETAAQVAACC